MTLLVTVKVELFYKTIWNDITDYAYTRDNVNITRGIQNEASLGDPATCTLTLNNRDGRFSTHNPLSPLYGLIGRNTPLRVSAGGVVRFVGEVSSWPQYWDQSGTDIYTPITAAGILRRLGQGQNAAPVVALDTFIRSTVYENAWSGLTAADFNSTAALALVGCPTVQFGAGDLSIGQNGILIPTTSAVRDANGYLTNGYIAGIVNSVGGASRVTLAFAFQASSLGPLSIAWTDYRLVNSTEYELLLRADGTNNDVVIIQRVNDGAGGITVTTLGDSGALSQLTDGALHDVEVTFAVSGADVDFEIDIDSTPVLTGGTVASLDGVEFFKIAYEPTTSNSPVSLAYLAFWSDSNEPAFADYHAAAQGNLGETAGDRFTRLCSENNITGTLVGTAADTMAMGSQGNSKLVDLLTEIATTEQGFIFDTIDAIGLTFVTRQALYNQAAAVTLDYSTNVFGAPLNPVDDDFGIHNDVTVTGSTAGGSARKTLDSGALSMQAPPDGINTYSTSASVNTATTGPLADLAGWLLAKSTIDEPRYPTLTLNMLNPRITGNGTLLAAIKALDITDGIAITNLPAWLPPDAVGLLMLGINETFTQEQWTAVFNCLSATPYQVAVYGTSRFEPEDSSVHTSFNTTATSLSIDSAANTQLWTTDAGAFPLDVMIAGERMTVSAISGSSSPQTFTISARHVNGVTKSHVSGEAVQLATRSRFAL